MLASRTVDLYKGSNGSNVLHNRADAQDTYLGASLSPCSVGNRPMMETPTELFGLIYRNKHE